jgi:hypothetical protein
MRDLVLNHSEELGLHTRAGANVEREDHRFLQILHSNLEMPAIISPAASRAIGVDRPHFRRVGAGRGANLIDSGKASRR